MMCYKRTTKTKQRQESDFNNIAINNDKRNIRNNTVNKNILN